MRAGVLELTCREDENYTPGAWVNEMARRACLEHGADWVIHADADEFWWPQAGALKDVLAAVPERFGALLCPWRHFAPRPDDGRHFAERMIVRRSSRAPDTGPDEQFHAHTNVAHRAHPDVTIHPGNHDLDAPFPTLRGWFPIEVLHFPIRSRAQAEAKFPAWSSLQPGIAPHVDAAGSVLRDGDFDAYWRRYVVDDDACADGLADGTLAIDTRLRDALRTLAGDVERPLREAPALPARRAALLPARATRPRPPRSPTTPPCSTTRARRPSVASTASRRGSRRSSSARRPASLVGYGPAESDVPRLILVPKSELDRVRAADVDPDERLALLADLCRLNALVAIKRAGSGHLGSSFSALDIVAHLLFAELNVAELGFDDPDRDVFFSSKGHDVPGLYAALFGLGVIPRERLLRLRRLGGLDGHPDVGVPGIEANSGSLGMGISKGRGIAWAKRRAARGGPGRRHDRATASSRRARTGRRSSRPRRSGSAASGSSSTATSSSPTSRPRRSSRCATWSRSCARSDGRSRTCDGHDHAALRAAFASFRDGDPDTPKALVARTIKGRGRLVHGASGSARRGRRHLPLARGRAAGRGLRARARRDRGAHRRAAGARSASIRSQTEPVDTEEGAVGEPVSGAGTTKPAVTDEYVADAYGEALVELGAEHEHLVVLDADLASDCRIRAFELAYPDRFVQCGIAEQDLVSTAAGLARHGFLPVVNSFASFLASRANEQIYNQASEGSKVVYALHYAGLIPAGPGKSHQSIRDVSLLGALPNMTIVQPANAEETRALLRWAVEDAEENVAIRLAIGPSPRKIELPAAVDRRARIGPARRARRGAPRVRAGAAARGAPRGGDARARRRRPPRDRDAVAQPRRPGLARRRGRGAARGLRARGPRARRRARRLAPPRAPRLRADRVRRRGLAGVRDAGGGAPLPRARRRLARGAHARAPGRAVAAVSKRVWLVLPDQLSIRMFFDTGIVEGLRERLDGRLATVFLVSPEAAAEWTEGPVAPRRRPDRVPAAGSPSASRAASTAGSTGRSATTRSRSGSTAATASTPSAWRPATRTGCWTPTAPARSRTGGRSTASWSGGTSGRAATSRSGSSPRCAATARRSSSPTRSRGTQCRSSSRRAASACPWPRTSRAGTTP